MEHGLWITYCGVGDEDRTPGTHYPVVGITDNGCLWVPGDRKTIVTVQRTDYEVYAVAYEEPRAAAPQSAPETDTPTPAYRATVKRAR